jgi:hypothetical protein
MIMMLLLIGRAGALGVRLEMGGARRVAFGA